LLIFYREDDIIIITTRDSITNRSIEKYHGIVTGVCVQTENLGKDIGTSFRSVVGGEAPGYTKMVETSIRTAMTRLQEEAKQLGANAIVSVRFSTSQTKDGAAEIIIYGTAVTIRKRK
jgi:uncharacterized protein YbjQ (UPF0145 family)